MSRLLLASQNVQVALPRDEALFRSTQPLYHRNSLELVQNAISRPNSAWKFTAGPDFSKFLIHLSLSGRRGYGRAIDLHGFDCATHSSTSVTKNHLRVPVWERKTKRKNFWTFRAVTPRRILDLGKMDCSVKRNDLIKFYHRRSRYVTTSIRSTPFARRVT